MVDSEGAVPPAKRVGRRTDELFDHRNVREEASREDQLETGAQDAIPSTTPITAVWTSKDWDMGLPSFEKRVHWVETRFKKGTGTATITLKKGTGQTVDTLTHDISSVDNASETVSRRLQGASEGAKNEFFSMSVSIASTATSMEFIAAGLLWTQAGNPTNST